MPIVYIEEPQCPNMMQDIRSVPYLHKHPQPHAGTTRPDLAASRWMTWTRAASHKHTHTHTHIHTHTPVKHGIQQGQGDGGKRMRKNTAYMKFFV